MWTMCSLCGLCAHCVDYVLTVWTTDYSQSIGPNDDDKADDDDEPVLRTTSSVVSCSHATKVQLRRRQNQRPETISSECTKHLTNIVLVPSPLVCPVPHCLLKIDFEYLSISHFSLLCVRCSVPAFFSVQLLCDHSCLHSYSHHHFTLYLLL